MPGARTVASHPRRPLVSGAASRMGRPVYAGRHRLRVPLALRVVVVLGLTAGAVAAAGPEPGQRAPEATFVAVDGTRFNLSAYRGRKAVVVLFTRGSTGSFACYYCGIQTRDFKREYAKVKAAGAEVLVVLPGPSDIAGYLRQVGESSDPPDARFSVPFPVVADPDFSASRAFGVPYTANTRGPMFVSRPAAFVIGRDGTVLYAYHGKSPSDRPALRAILDVLQGQRPADAPEAPQPAPTDPKTTLAWTTYEAGMASAKSQRKPLLLEFYADWCGNCTQMDMLVYSDERIRAQSTSFVPIRVEFDQRQDLVERYSVGAGLPVLVLMDPDGRELSRLTGFSRVAKVLAACKAALEGEAPEADAPPSPTKATVAATPESIAAAKAKALSFLRSAWPNAKPTGPGFGPDDLVLFALASNGAGPADPDVARLLAKVLSTPLAGTYQASIRALALARLDPKRHAAALRACADFLAQGQLENGQWSYGTTLGATLPKVGDNSNSAYALLGLYACRAAGVDVSRALFQRADRWWRRSQNADGGWGYRSDREVESYASMTESGLSSLILCARALGRPPTDEAVEKARAWVTTHFSVEENAKSAYQQGRVLYHLYALERAGTLLSVERFGEHEWFREGAARLLSTQAEDGSWDDGSETYLSNTCFGLLFLTRPTAALR